TDVEIAVRLGREAGMDAALILVGLEVLQDDIADEIGGAGCGRRRRGGIRRVHDVFNFPMACAMRRRQVSRPRGSRPMGKGAKRTLSMGNASITSGAKGPAMRGGVAVGLGWNRVRLRRQMGFVCNRLRAKLGSFGNFVVGGC